MNTPVFFSQRVLNTINALPDSDRQAIAHAITGEFILGAESAISLTPLQSLVFAIVRQYVEHDTHHIALQK